MGNSRISYLYKVWNPILGCSPKMPCAARCWAWKQLARWARPDTTPEFEVIKYDGPKAVGWNGSSVLVETRLDAPLHWRKPQRVGVCFLGDLFPL